jgi:hypothetical protein
MKLEEATSWCAAVLCLLSSSVLLAQTPTHSVKDNGAIGDGRADDTAPLQSALNLGGTIYLPPGTYLISKNLIIGSHTTLQGPGTIEAIRPGIASILIEGHAENLTNVSHAIALGANTIPFANSLKKRDLIEISSFPSDQSDSYTVPNGCTLNCPRYYSAYTARSQRSFRRKEINEVASATPQSISLVHATLSAYPANPGTVIKKMIPASSVSLRDLTLHNVNVQSTYATDLVIGNVTALASSFVAASCYRCHINYANFDAQGTESRVDVYESSRFIDVSGTYKNFNANADNGIVKLNQASDVNLNVSIGDTEVSGSGNPALTHGVMIDTNYAENPAGFADVPSHNLSGTVTSVGTAPSDLFITANPFVAPVRGVSITTKRGTRVYLKGVTDATINIEGLCSVLRLDGSQSITINGGDIGYLFTQELTDPTAPQSAKKLESITFNNSTFTITDQIPFFHSFEGLLLNNVTFDVSHQSRSANAHVIPIANLNDVSNLVLKHLKVVQRSDQKGTQIWTSGPVSNVSATGQVPVPFSTNIPIAYTPQ